MSTFHVATLLMTVITAGVMAVAYAKTRDSLHPALVLGSMLLFLYVGMPLYLLNEDGFFGFLTEGQLGFAQVVNGIGVAALLLGLMAGASGGVFTEGRAAVLTGGPGFARAGILIGSAGVVGYLAGLVTVGGFAMAYGRGYGGGYSPSGYVRELYFLTIPAILLMLLSGEAGKRRHFWAWVVVFAAPLAVQGLLGGRRGPTFLVIVAVAAGTYLIRGSRPGIFRVAAGGAVLGGLLLFLVTNREKIYVGSDFEFEGDVTGYLDAGSGNEFIYGAGTIITASETGRFAWGGRYATVLFIRPIPRAIWPEKYDFARRTFGVDMERNLGIDIEGMSIILGWTGAVGAAPGIVADMFLEFSWFYVGVLAALGAVFGWAWRRAVNDGRLWVVYYGVLLSLSVYFVMQTLEAALFRALLMIAPVWIAERLLRLHPRVLRPARAG